MAPALLVEEIDDDSSIESRKITLDEVETRLRRLLLDVAAFIDSKNSQEEATVLRFTGGWVRDKLLGVRSHDIDVAINNMTGRAFGLGIKEYLEVPGNEAKYILDSKTIGDLHTIAKNPERSKHLETTCLHILGLDLDLVNLRKETYTEDSRNPQMEFGTPEEDALRRDATVNAMFYNLNTQQVEDFTGRGFQDMHDKILRTPMEPYQTFKDDPLRVLRLIRFASRLGWIIEPSTLTAMSHQDIKDALQVKISRERVGVELEKALRGPDPHEALRLIFELNLYDVIFCDPTAEANSHNISDQRDWQATIDCLRNIIRSGDVIAQIITRDADEEFLAWMLASFIPYRDCDPSPASLVPGRRPPPTFPARVARDGIKATSKVFELVATSMMHLNELRTTANDVYQRKQRPEKSVGSPDVLARDNLGMKIRSWGPTWRSQLVFALLSDITDQPESDQVILRKYRVLLEHLRDLDILDAYQFKPLLDGKQLAKILAIKPGPWMKHALDVVMAWQLRNPQQKDTSGAIEEVKKHGELAFLLATHFLELTIRPLFAKSRPHNVTTQGRRNINPAITADQSFANDDAIKPWKSSEHSIALELLRWSSANLDSHQLESLWPLIVPPVLTLIDDWEAKYKTMGSDLLFLVLSNTPTELLKRTGLAPVFEDALLPCLTFLPSITSEVESVELSTSVYRTIIQLGNSAYPATTENTSFLPPSRSALFDKVIRKGILYGYSHAGQHPALAIVFFDALHDLILELDIESVKHLKFIVPMVVEHLAHPLAASHVSTCTHAVRTLRAICRSAWPRIDGYASELFKGLAYCWIQVSKDFGEDARVFRQESRRCVTELSAIIKTKAGLQDDLEMLVAADPRLKELLLPDRPD